MKTEYKVNIGKEDLPGYWNTDSILLEEVETNQATEILIDLSLGRIPTEKIPGVMKIWSEKLRKGGKLILNDLDLNQLAKAITSKKNNDLQINQLLYGNRVSCLTLETVSNIIRSLGLKILKRSLVEFEYSIEAVRE